MHVDNYQITEKSIGGTRWNLELIIEHITILNEARVVSIHLQPTDILFSVMIKQWLPG